MTQPKAGTATAIVQLAQDIAVGCMYPMLTPNRYVFVIVRVAMHG